MEKVNTHSLNQKREEVLISGNPSNCPKCHTSIYPEKRSSYYIISNQDLINVTYQCTNCENLFISSFKRNGHGRMAGRKYKKFVFIKSEPIYPTEHDFSDEIKNLSKDFVDIYNQAKEAETKSLDQLHGLGLRKSIEFLIKDFSIHLKPDKEESIKKSSLSQCIDNFIEDPRIKQIANRAVWIGNDEAHYTRRWEDKDVSDLEILIRITVNFIESSLLSEKYKKEMKK